LWNAASQAEYEKYARMPIIPLVVTPEGVGVQDSVLAAGGCLAGLRS
jgi:hypothetical protein